MVIDPKSHVSLWVLTEYSEPAGREKNREKNYEAAMTTLIGDVKALVSPPTQPK